MDAAAAVGTRPLRLAPSPTPGAALLPSALEEELLQRCQLQPRSAKKSWHRTKPASSLLHECVASPRGISRKASQRADWDALAGLRPLLLQLRPLPGRGPGRQ